MVKGYLAFMDHSITEQLTGCPTAWHTTVVALSEGGEVSDLANRIAYGIFPRQPRLRKWSAGRPAGKQRYREAFYQELARHLPSSKVYLLATSATESTIIYTRKQLFQELGIAELSQERTRSGGSPILRVGPFTNPESGADHYFELPLNRALMVVWVAHFVARMHPMFRLQLQGAQPEPVVVDWFFYHDKFAGDSPGGSPAMSFFQMLVSGNISDGNVRSGFFVESDKVEADLFADNVAGLFNSSRERGVQGPDLSSLLGSGCIYYEMSSPAS
jgi:hypothetical protein